jgi:hypothetical protein
MLRVIAGRLPRPSPRDAPGLVHPSHQGPIRESLFDCSAARPRTRGPRPVRRLERAGTRRFARRPPRGLRESARAALRALRENVATLGLGSRVTVVPGDALEPSPSTRGPFDLILADPPYDAAVEQRLVEESAKRLAPRGVLALEHAADRPAPEAPSGLAIWKARRYGGTSLTLYVRVAEETS